MMIWWYEWFASHTQMPPHTYGSMKDMSVLRFVALAKRPSFHRKCWKLWFHEFLITCMQLWPPTCRQQNVGDLSIFFSSQDTYVLWPGRICLLAQRHASSSQDTYVFWPRTNCVSDMTNVPKPKFGDKTYEQQIVFHIEKWNVGNHLKRVFPTSQPERNHPRGVNGRSKFHQTSISFMFSMLKREMLGIVWNAFSQSLRPNGAVLGG